MAVEAKYGKSRLAGTNVDKAGFTSYVPLVKSESGKRIVPLFDEYFFVRWTRDWVRVNHVREVSRVLTIDNVPGIVHRDFIVELKSLENKRGIVELTKAEEVTPPVRQRLFADGAAVKPKCGTWLNQLGIVEGAGRGHMVSVLFSLLGRQVRVELDEGDLVAAQAAA